MHPFFQNLFLVDWDLHRLTDLDFDPWPVEFGGRAPEPPRGSRGPGPPPAAPPPPPAAWPSPPPAAAPRRGRPPKRWPQGSRLVAEKTRDGRPGSCRFVGRPFFVCCIFALLLFTGKRRHTWSLHDLVKNGSMPSLFWVMTPFVGGHGDSRYGCIFL